MTNTELAILGLVVEAPRHGYEIEQLIEGRGMRSWTEVGFSSIYYILGKLERRGWLRSHREPAAGRGPQRKVYTALPAGLKAWTEGTLKLLADPGGPRPFLLGLAGLPGLPAGEALAALRGYRRGLLARRDEVETAWQSGGQLPYFLEGMFEYSFNLLQTEIEWLDRYIPRLESQVDE
ncbi:MAG: PadR family transcriptional regulator [Anaerolineales bacterium]|nr:PadR family transcriptional regulator [Anaerolineales bacterium]